VLQELDFVLETCCAVFAVIECLWDIGRKTETVQTEEPRCHLATVGQLC